MTSLHPESLSWAALLGRWIEFAQASVALPRDDDGGRWRASVVSVITLQAVCFALAEIDELDADERALALDKAELLIAEHAGLLEQAWERRALPGALAELVDDARSALNAAGSSPATGVTELVWAGPGPLVMPAVEHGTLEKGTLALMAPGTIAMPGEPVAWWSGRAAVALPGCRVRHAARPRQVYRQIDEHGRIRRDVIATIDADVEPGMPLLVPLLAEGRPIGRFLMEADDWLVRQRAAMTGEEIPVEEVA